MNSNPRRATQHKKARKTAPPVSPFSTGGGGIRFETLVALSYVVSLLNMEFPRGASGIVRSVRLQQRNRSCPVDDIVVSVDEGHQLVSALALQVKHALGFSDNREFREVVRSCWEHSTVHGFRAGIDKIGVAIGEASYILKVRTHLQEMLDWAAKSESGGAFFLKAQKFKEKAAYLRMFSTILSDAATRPLSEEEIWLFLRSFVVIPFEFDTPGSRDSRDLYNGLLRVVPGRDPVKTRSFTALLEKMVLDYAPRAGEITLDGILTGIPETAELLIPSNLDRTLRTTREALALHARIQLDREKRSGRYIPDIFVEVSYLKDQVRGFVHPLLFLRKTLDDFRRFDTSRLNQLLSMIGQPEYHAALPRSMPLPADLGQMYDSCQQLVADIQKEDATLRAMALSADSPAKQHVAQEVYYALSPVVSSLVSQLAGMLDDVKTLRAQVLILLGRAGHGKTNFVCDLAENVLGKRGLPFIFICGRDISRADPQHIGERLVRLVFGDRFDGQLDSMICELERLSRSVGAPVTIVVDGINEHVDLPAFAPALENLVGRLVTSPAIRVVLTCRSEYYEDRFSNLAKAGFADRTVTVGIGERGFEMSDKHKKQMMEGYLHFFHLAPASISPWAEDELTANPLLLRIFCEAYGDPHRASTLPHPNVLSIYRAEVFRLYLDKKLRGLTERAATGMGAAVGADHRYKQALSRVLDYMLAHAAFSNIPIAEFDDTTQQVLAEMIGEDVFFRRDLPGGRSVLDVRGEVINFTYDEFRDFLLADRLVASDNGLSQPAVTELVDRYTAEQCAAAEGLRAFLYIASRQLNRSEVLEHLQRKDWYKEELVSGIFEVPDDSIKPDEVALLRERFMTNRKDALHIAVMLIQRHRTDLYPNLSIRALFAILDTLDQSGYDTLWRPLFGMSTDRGPFDRAEAPIKRLCQSIQQRLSDPGTHTNSRESIMELLVWLCDVRDEHGFHPAQDVLDEFIPQWPELALRVFERYTHSALAPLRRSAWDSLAHMAEQERKLPKRIEREACNQLRQMSQQGNANDTSPIYSVGRFLEASSAASGRHIPKDIQNIVTGLFPSLDRFLRHADSKKR